jgi:hypothetical protein
MEFVPSSDTLLNLHMAKQRHMPEESIFRSYQQEKLKSHERKGDDSTTEYKLW